VLERQRVSEEVKGLDQPARATLRKYGVRFGAYHIYLPLLLKPAPRALATQLWALKHEAPDAKGVAELLHLAASGRTSIPVDKETPKPLYRTAGYRVCGERAVRVDILERLADLIRPALSWREGATTAKPDGAVDGRSFTVTGAMTSLTGASGEDFASILRSLGYRMERRPKPVEAAPAETATPAAVPTEAPIEVAADAPVPDAELMPQAGEPIAAEAAPEAPVEPVPEPAQEPAQESAPAPPLEPAAEPMETVATEVEAAEQPAAAPVEEPAKEPETIEVWRPGGRSERRPHRPRRPHRAPPAAATEAAAPAEAAAAPAPASEPAQSPRPQREERPDRQVRRDRHERQQRTERDGERGNRSGRPDRRDGKRRRRDEGPDRAEREQYYAKPFGGGARQNKEPDPNSPFAKLAALKQQLEQKERP
jgi:ATP-dependent RNA helicase SUPV3L1/SUV3